MKYLRLQCWVLVAAQFRHYDQNGARDDAYGLDVPCQHLMQPCTIGSLSLQNDDQVLGRQ